MPRPLKSVNRWTPYLVALAAFLTVTLLYFAPQFRGDVLPQGDVRQYEGMTQDIYEHQDRYGEDPQWAGRMFSGMPAYLINVRYEGTLIRTITGMFHFLGQPASLIFLALAGFYLMLLCLGINPWVAIVPALAYGFSSFFLIIIGAGHVTQMMALAFAPMMMGGIFYAYRHNMWVGAALTAFFASALIGANHPQISYYFLLIIAAFWINELVQAIKNRLLPRFAKTTGLLVLAAALAVGSNAAMLYYIGSHSSDTIRGGSELAPADATPETGAAQENKRGLDLDYATAWSYGKAETFNLLIPNLYGGSSSGGFSADGEVARSLAPYNARNLATQLPAYWGPQPFTEGPVYLGAVILLIAVVGLFTLRRRQTRWVAAITLLAVLLSWGRHMMWFTELFFNWFPLYNKFRTVSMILVIVEWTVPFLGALTLQQIWMGELSKKELRKGLKYALSAVGGLLLFFLLFGGSLFSFTSPQDGQFPQEVAAAMRSERADLLRGDALRSLIFVVLAAGVLWMYAGERLKRGVLITAMACLVLADLLPVDLRYLGHGDFVSPSSNQIRPTAADQQILEDKEPGFRVLNLAVSPFQDASTSYFHRSVGGYHGAKLRRYQDLIERQLSQMNWEVYNMLNTKYIITPDRQGGGAPQAQVNSDANGPAWFVREIAVVQGPDAEMAALDSLQTKYQAVVEGSFSEYLEGISPSADTTARIALTNYKVNHLTYEYTARTPGVALFSEIYYPKGWTAYVDGEEAPYFRANYVLRAMALPAGEHRVEFVFRAPHFQSLSRINLTCSLIILLGLAGVAAAAIFKPKQDGRQQQTNPTQST